MSQPLKRRKRWEVFGDDGSPFPDDYTCWETNSTWEMLLFARRFRWDGFAHVTVRWNRSAKAAR